MTQTQNPTAIDHCLQEYTNHLDFVMDSTKDALPHIVALNAVLYGSRSGADATEQEAVARAAWLKCGNIWGDRWVLSDADHDLTDSLRKLPDVLAPAMLNKARFDEFQKGLDDGLHALEGLFRRLLKEYDNRNPGFLKRMKALGDDSIC